MKVKSASAKNFAKFEQISVDFDPYLTYLIGKNGAGKSTVGLNILWAAMQGIAQKSDGGTKPILGERFRFVGPNGPSTELQITLIDEYRKNAEIKVTRRITRSGGTTLSFDAPEDYGVELNQTWLNMLFNVFLIAPKKFLELNSRQQALELGIDVTKYNIELAELKDEATILGRELRAFGDLQYVEKVEAVSLQELRDQKSKIQDRLQHEYNENVAKNKEIEDSYKWEVATWERMKKEYEQHITKNEVNVFSATEALKTLRGLGYNGNEVSDFIDKLAAWKPEKQFTDAPPVMPELPDPRPDQRELADIDEKIEAAVETNVQAERYRVYSEQLEKKNNVVKKIDDNKAAQAKKIEERNAYIKTCKLPFKNLTVNDDGELLFDGKPIKEQYFSTGELLKLIPILLVQQNPEFKYIFLQDFWALDEDKQKEVIDYLTKQGFQLVIEKVGKTKEERSTSILLKDQKVVDTYETEENDSPNLNV